MSAILLDPNSAIGQVVNRLNSVIEGRRHHDGIRVFAEMYRDVTRLIGVRVAEGHFQQPRYVEHLDVVFANLFLEVPQALASDRPVEKAWQPLVERRHEQLFPLQFALAGMNAHINHDLSIAMVTTCHDLRITPETPGIQEDFDRINAVLAEQVRPIRHSFLEESVVQYGARLSPLADLLSAFSIERARDAAWASTLTLWALRDIGFIQDRARASLSRTVGLVSRQLLVPFDPTGRLGGGDLR